MHTFYPGRVRRLAHTRIISMTMTMVPMNINNGHIKYIYSVYEDFFICVKLGNFSFIAIPIYICFDIPLELCMGVCVCVFILTFSNIIITFWIVY